MSSSIKIEQIEFLNGTEANQPTLIIRPSTVTVFVGPNSSGKSLALHEIEQICSGKEGQRKIIKEVEISSPNDLPSAKLLLKKFETTPPPNVSAQPNQIWVQRPTLGSTPGGTEQIDWAILNRAITMNLRKDVRRFLIGFYTVRLDGRTRFHLITPTGGGDTLAPPQNHLQALVQNDAARKIIRDLTNEAFGVYLVVDPTDLGKLRLKVSSRPPSDETEEQAFDTRARAFHRAAQDIENQSDGVQAFVGLICAILSLPHQIILIDEPEAFLHPPLARRLARNLSLQAAKRDASLFVSTHSADFLMGCIESPNAATIVRLTYERGVAAARAMASSDVQLLMRDPLLRTTGAMRGLFHRSVIVTESETDRAFYDEINHRLVNESRGVNDSLFINAQNWQTIARIIGPLRKLGIPAAGILDMDAISDPTGWRNIYESIYVSTAQRASIETERSACEAILKSIANKRYKEDGISAANATDQIKLKSFICLMQEYGIFLVSVGELESWLKHLSIRGDKVEWLVASFERLGNDPKDINYVKPGNDDVWAFLDSITTWTEDPSRKGIPN